LLLQGSVQGKQRSLYWAFAFWDFKLRLGLAWVRSASIRAMRFCFLAVYSVAASPAGDHFLCCCKESNQRKQLFNHARSTFPVMGFVGSVGT
jgi:hypothetical protein